MASIKAIEGRSIHQIQSGQVIVDLCSVVKELVENSLDAKASSIEVRFKNNGLESIEVQDNGAGIAPEDFESIALKHYTSKLSSYDDLSSLSTFGFRGEALSSMCALSDFHVITARECDKPRGTRLDFETTGKLKTKTVVASSKGTTVAVEQLFKNLPVRRKELERNIKREFQKVLSLLNAYACISVGVRFNVSNVAAKGKKSVVFSTQGHASTRENIANVFSAKAVTSLLALDLSFKLQPSTPSGHPAPVPEDGKEADSSREVQLVGHISRPVVGEGRLTPDRQMFFVNSRPCQLPQVAKAINEVYRSYNVTQSPFVFANLILDTNAYDVNVSPDKRTILLHDQPALLEALKTSLTDLFEKHEQSVPRSNILNRRNPAYTLLTIDRSGQSPPVQSTVQQSSPALTSSSANSGSLNSSALPSMSSIREFASRAYHGESDASSGRHEEQTSILLNDDHTVATIVVEPNEKLLPRRVEQFNERMRAGDDMAQEIGDGQAPNHSGAIDAQDERRTHESTPVGSKSTASRVDEESIPVASIRRDDRQPGELQAALARTRPRRLSEQTATITIGNIITTTKLGQAPIKDKPLARQAAKAAKRHESGASNPVLLRSLRVFAAPGSQLADREMDDFDLRAAARESDDSNSSTPDTNDSVEQGDEQHGSSSQGAETESDDEYVDEEEKKQREEIRVARLVADAEASAARPTDDNMKRAIAVFKGRPRKDAALSLVQHVETSIDEILDLSRDLEDARRMKQKPSKPKLSSTSDSITAEDRLALTVSKSDFKKMRIVGQFNLGFILTVRPATADLTSTAPSDAVRSTDELFIIDQHASDEKFNFERLQAITVVQNQPLVIPKELDLTAVDEEIILNNREALVKNGFIVEDDMSGALPVGRRCRLMSLPMSKEVTFGTQDLEELLALLADHAISKVPRPSKVRRMFAMRACRSSIMVGRTLTSRQMETVVRHMGEIDKPWNCPHGRPTMRHLFGLDSWQSWQEGDGLTGMQESCEAAQPWKRFLDDSDVLEEDADESMDDAE